MADLSERLYCFKCEEHSYQVERRLPKTAFVKCQSCKAENTIESIRGAMHLKGIKPKRHPTPTTRN